MKWTDEQLTAITKRGCSLLVAAAAGSGKTAVLVERIIRRITDIKNPVDIDRLLVVTFTNAAASEMKERITKRLSELRLSTPDRENNIKRQITLVNRANIMTIHAFCLEIIRNNFHLTDLDPDFRVADETEVALLKNNALEIVFEENFTKDSLSNDFKILLDTYSSFKDDSGLREVILNIYEFIQTCPWPYKWLQKQVENLNVDTTLNFASTLWGKVIAETVKIEIEGAYLLIKEALLLAQRQKELESYCETLTEDARMLENSLKNYPEKDWDRIYDLVLSLKFSKLKASRKCMDTETKDIIKSLRDKAKKIILHIKEELLIGSSSEVLCEIKKVYPLIKALYRVVIEFSEQYTQIKRRKNVVDFHDLEHICLEMLIEIDEDSFTPTETAKRLQDRYEEILIDEYQDSNLVQEYILRAVSREEYSKYNRFMVGDVKQSIYRFRQARPELFLEKYKLWESDGKDCAKVLLSKNFRSRKEIIKGVNTIFRMLMSEKTGELDYSSEEQLNEAAVYPENKSVCLGGSFEINLIDLNDEIKEHNAFTYKNNLEVEEFLEDLDKAKAEAVFVACKIQEMIKKNRYHIFDKSINGYRLLEYRDIVILMRATTGWTAVFTEYFAAKQIPLFSDGGSGYFDSVEVKVMLSMLKVIDNPLQDIPLLSVLRAPWIRFTEEELLKIRMINKEKEYYNALIQYSKEGEDEHLALRCRKFIESLSKWREESKYLEIDQLLWKLYLDTGYYYFVSAMPDGMQRRANLKLLMYKARQFEQTSYKGLFNFIKFVEKLKKEKNTWDNAKVLGENENVVRLMSIHKSKGLEFPVVFFCGVSRKFNFMDTTGKMLLHYDLGIGPDYIDPQLGIVYPTAAKQALRIKIKQETLAEEMRILYVAFTRAKERLIVCGSVKNLKKEVLSWQSSLDKDRKFFPYHVNHAKCLLDWIASVILHMPEGKVIEDYLFKPKSFLNGCFQVYNVSIYNTEGLINLENKYIGATSLAKTELPEEENLSQRVMEEIEKRINWEYPDIYYSKIPAKISVTQLREKESVLLLGEAEGYDRSSCQDIAKPLFMDDLGRLDAAGFGTAVHIVMQHLDYNRTDSADKIKLQLKEMVLNEYITEIQAEAISVESIQKFFLTDLGTRLKKASVAYREMSFTIYIPAYIFDPKCRRKDDKILVQGIIDCWFKEGSGVVLLDYKTDSVKDVELLKQRYSIQLNYYAKALEIMTGMRVKEKYLYLFKYGKVVLC